MFRCYASAARVAKVCNQNKLLRTACVSSAPPLPSSNVTQSSRSSFSTSYQPPPNNTYHGTPVYNDIDIGINKITDAAAARNNDADAVFVVTGASRSMGLEFVKQLLTRTKGRIVACILRPGSSPALDDALGQLSRDDRARVHVTPLDVTNEEQIVQLRDELQSMYGRVDGLFNVAGVLGDKTTTPGPEMNLSQLDQTWLQNQFAVNAIGPLMITSKLTPLLKARKGRNKYLRETGSKESVVVNLSARVASMSDNTGGLAWYSYRMSKAALNQGVRTSSHELRRQGTWTIALYPGMTDTDMSQPFQSKTMKEKGLVFPVSFTVGRLLDVVDAMEEEQSGGMYDWAGQCIAY
ncbi:short-chain dehydrogenase/reductase family protein [Skeletonema marinoi]|uniref:Short-chain dehydrogenase/reductase family protein n=1 Tax=Skeletonema marinoi TaxID=267567 RepID=A0AAD9D9Q4_9STRA|nr:short-chain dehydrogenase/reductase family protein [Skeletonema marinoi]